MITTEHEYEAVSRQLKELEERLERLQQNHPGHDRGLTKAGVRKMIARLHEELALYEGELEVKHEPVK